MKLPILFLLILSNFLVKSHDDTSKESLELTQLEDMLNGSNRLKGTASLTYYNSYAACCKNNPNYDPNADKTECEDDDACRWSGDFAAIGHKSYDWVKTHNIVAFYDDSDRQGRQFMKKYGGKYIQLTKNGKTFTAIIADTCANSDCNNCCHNNSRPTGYLVDLEYNTAINIFGSTKSIEGQISFVIMDAQEDEEPINPINPQSYCNWKNHCAGDPCRTFYDCDGDLICNNGKCGAIKPQCKWKDHCLGEPCRTYYDCDGNLTCNNGKCGKPQCWWKNHCLGDTCETFDDCDGDLTCQNGKCA